MIDAWWDAARAHQVLPLDDRFGPRFAENARRAQGERTEFVFHAGMGHLPTDVAPDVRTRGYRIEADVRIDDPHASGVLVAHGDATSGYSLYLLDGRLVHDMNVGGTHHVLHTDAIVGPGRHRLGFTLALGPLVERATIPGIPPARVPSVRIGTLTVDDAPCARIETHAGFNTMVSWSGLDIGLDRGSPVSHYEAPFALRGARLYKVIVRLDPPAPIDGDAIARAEVARQ